MKLEFAMNSLLLEGYVVEDWQHTDGTWCCRATNTKDGEEYNSNQWKRRADAIKGVYRFIKKLELAELELAELRLAAGE